MSEEYKKRLLKIVKILENPNEISTIYPEVENTRVEKLIINPYQLSIPKWLIGCIDICCGEYKHFALVIFIELLTSIRARRYNGDLPPANYIIIPDDWCDCYEDGYPICMENNETSEIYSQMYNEYTMHLRMITNALS